MSAPSKKRWVCPRCGDGVLGPQRPRRDDVRRYCLACSASTGRLVERTCPALERERADRGAKRAARTARANERQRSAEVERRTVGGVDLMAEARRFAKLPALRDGIERNGFPNITIRRSTSKRHTSGFCSYTYPASITVTVGTDPYDAPGTVLHEMVHAVVLSEGHSAGYWSLLQRAAREAWPEARFDFANASRGWRCQRAIRDGLAGLAGAVPPVRLEAT